MKPPETLEPSRAEDGGRAPSNPPRRPERQREPYRAPRLTQYGRLADLTQFGGSQVVDSGSGLGNLP